MHVWTIILITKTINLRLLIKGFSNSTPVQLTVQETHALGSEKNVMVRDVTYKSIKINFRFIN